MTFLEILTELKQLKHGSFKFRTTDNLRMQCNAPNNAAGVYIVFDADDENTILYIGRSGSNNNNEKFIRQDGIFGRLVSGKQFGESRSKSWPIKMKQDGINAIKVNWYVLFYPGTPLDEIKASPENLESFLISKHIEIYNYRPKWQ